MTERPPPKGPKKVTPRPNIAGEIAALWSAGTPIVYLVTVEEARAEKVCAEAAAAFDAMLGVWSSHRGLQPFAPAAKHPVALLDAVAKAPSPALIVLLDFHEQLADPQVARKLRDMVPSLTSEGRCLVIVASRLALPEGLASDVAVLRLPLPNEGELGEVLDGLMPGSAPQGQARHRALGAARGLTEGQARRAFLRSLRQDPNLSEPAVQTIIDEKKRILARDLGLEHVDMMVAGHPLVMDDLGGLTTFKDWVEERAQAFAPEARRFGLPAPRGVLLVGVQGCGKSLAAKVVAKALGVPLLRLDLPRVFGGGTSGAATAEESLQRALEACEAISPVALWVDEIEKGFAGSAPGKSGDTRATRLLGSFSTWLQERQSAVFVVATANDVTSLPPELLRRGRFDELFFVDLPDREARRAILAVHLRRRGRDPVQFDVNELADQCENFSGAELEQVVVGALHRAFAQARDLDPIDLRRVAQDVVPLYKTYEEQIKALREWARGRARVAGREGAVVDLFRRTS